jgi:hypothetical protein
VADSISNRQDVIDSRDVIARIEELQEYRDDAEEHAKELLEELAVLQEREQREDADDWTLDDADRVSLLEGETAKTWSHDGKREFYASTDFDQDEEEELRILEALAEEAEGYAADWHHGEALIRESYFETYAQQLADDLGYTGSGKTDHWPFTCIDWEQAAEELQQDYTSVDFDGVTYFIR